ncbi:MAG: putative membrane protein [Candidatus Roizmanbacteria bacterium GW2011_GWA2_32_13]|uniref:Putative membrane protein n=1 Tax=Candidatus Roizmanbacteria bacterium GW2011_GWA2_32_13 TaxID=1618475 RepID=A0A0F9YYX3_9BACT|nr:MAG: putative membrane protein [Candidatus Roizmanbacteria bacterium GW2011_GWA2_32_13]
MKKIVVILFLISVLFISFLPVKDTDFGWHYRCGKEFLTAGVLCIKNNFSYFLPSYQSYYTGHLYDTILAFIYDHWGFLGISFVGSIIFTLTALVFIKLINSIKLSFVTYFISFILSYSILSLGFRPQIITYLFLLILLLLLKSKNKRLFFLIPILFLFWVNLHIGFFIGLFVLIFFIFYENKGINRFQKLFIIFISFLTTLINPFGLNVYREILNHLTSPLGQMIAEWVKPSFFHLFLITSFTIIGLIIIIKKKPINLFYLLLLIFFSFLSLSARRNLPLFYPIFFYITQDSFKSLKKLGWIQYEMLISIICSVIIFILIIYVPKTIEFDALWTEYCQKGQIVYPCQAIKKFPQLTGNVFNTYEWGGFLIWQKPNNRVFVDGRMPAWRDENGKSPYQVFLEIIQTQPGWNEKLNRWKTNYILITNGTFLDLLLQKESIKYNWQEVYRDDIAVIYKNIK